VWVLLKNHSWVTASSTKVRFVVQVYFVFNAHDFFDPVRQPAEYFTVRDGKIKKHGTKNDQNTPARKQKREEREKKMKKKGQPLSMEKKKAQFGPTGTKTLVRYCTSTLTTK